MMSVLVVEDEADALDRLEREIKAAGIQAEVEVARSRETAIGALTGQTFDIIVCDLKLPPVDGALDADEAHGRAVLAEARNLKPGTPVLVLSGVGKLENLSDFLSGGPVEDCFGDRRGFKMAAETSKRDYDKAIATLREVAAHVEALDAVDINFGVQGPFLSKYQQRILKIYARQMNADLLEVSRLTGGYSGAETVRCAFRGSSTGGGLVAAKIATLSDIHEEHERYVRFVPASLDPGAYVSDAGLVTSGAGDLGGAFYRLADRFTSSLFAWVMSRDQDSATTIRHLHGLASPWRALSAWSEGPIRDVRQALLGDDVFENIVALGPEAEWRGFEDRTIRFVRQTQHGDLHPLNVLVDANGVTILIDFGRVGGSFAGIDPITLELGAIFNPGSRTDLGGWPSIEEAGQWAELTRYADRSPFPAFIKECRTWAFNDTSDKAVYAIAWAYALRQCQYEGVNRDVALAIAASAYAAYQQLGG